MIFVIKKTTDLLSTDIRLILNLYESVFHKRKCYNEFIDEFSQNDFGYSIHAICYDKEVVVGHNVYIPMMYNRGSESFFAALSVDAMVHEDYQNRGIYHRLVMECEEAAKKIGCKIRLGFPNNNSYPIQIKKFGYREIGQLDTYILPVKLDLFSSKYRIFDIFSIPLSFLLIHVSKISKYFRTSYNFLYHKSRETFDLYRYKWFNGNYNIIDDNDVKFIYKEYNFKGKSAFFLMDVFPMSKKNFDYAVRYIYNINYCHLPIIIYVGKLPFRPLSMIKVPRKLEPKRFYFLGKVLDESFENESIYNIKNWDVNLSNYDLL